MLFYQNYQQVRKTVYQMNLTSNQYAANTTTNLVLSGTTAILSMFGTMFILVTYYRWTSIQTTSRRILVYISVADFFLALGNLVGIFTRRRMICLVQSIVVTFSSLSSFFWTAFMAAYLYYGFSRRMGISREALICIFHIIGWGVPLAVTTTAASLQKLGYNADIVTSGWCWVSVDLSKDEIVEWMLITGKFWEILAYFTITVLYILVKRAINRQYCEQGLLDERENREIRVAEMKLILVPIVFITLHIWGTIRFFIFVKFGLQEDAPDTSWLLFLQGIGDNGQGFANFLIFCFCTERAKKALKSCSRKCFCCEQKPRNHMTKPQEITTEPQLRHDPNERSYVDLS